jgi:hypothetical protein
MKAARAGIVCFVVLAGPALAQTPKPTSEDVAAQAQDILRKRCFECHGQKADTSPAKFNILDHKALVERKIIVRGAPDDSELLALIADGTMPTGDRPPVTKEELSVLRSWVQRGAPPFPAGEIPIGDAYVLEKIWEDMHRLPGNDGSYARYFSLNHLLAEETTRKKLPLYTDALTQAIDHLSRKGRGMIPQPIEETNTVFRVDIRKLGWDDKPFVIVARDEEPTANSKSSLTLFDLILLEYPYGVVDRNVPNFNKLVKDFLETTKQVRPIAYLRGDWFVNLAIQTDFYQDFLLVPAKERHVKPKLSSQMIEAAQEFRNADLSLKTISAELGSRFSPGQLDKLLRRPAFEGLWVHLANGTVPRQNWDTYFPVAVRHLGIGTLLAPIDAVTSPANERDSPVDVDLKTDRANNVFPPKSEVRITVQNKTKEVLYFELSAAKKNVKGVLYPPEIVAPGQPRIRHLDTTAEESKEAVSVLACATKFPPGEVVKANNVFRIVHPFYQIQVVGPDIAVLNDPGYWVKKTIEIETKKN